ncbi:MAG: hypothetical protein ACC661_11580 [Verrucomicrobiales bacterium]
MDDAPFRPDNLHFRNALRVFAESEEKTQSQRHIKPLHQYLSLRLVIEGGFDPDEVTPHPPIRSEAVKGGYPLLHFDPEAETTAERTVLGGLKTKDIDVVVTKKNIGPVLAISVKGATGAFRNLTNRMEEAIGDSTNLHIMYPGLVYGFFQVIRGNREGETGLSRNDIAVDAEGSVVGSIRRYHNALAELSGRRFVRDDLTRYERVAFAVADTVPDRLGEVLDCYPPSESPLRVEGFFRFLLDVYDLRFPYAGPSLRSLKRNIWSENSPAFRALGGDRQMEEVLGYEARLGA